MCATRAIQLRNPLPLQLNSAQGYLLRKYHVLPKENDHSDSSR